MVDKPRQGKDREQAQGHGIEFPVLHKDITGCLLLDANSQTAACVVTADLSGKHTGTQRQQATGEQTEAQHQQTVKADSYLHVGADGQRLFRVRLIKVH